MTYMVSYEGKILSFWHPKTSERHLLEDMNLLAYLFSPICKKLFDYSTEMKKL